MGLRPGPFPDHLIALVDHETRQLQMLHDPLGQDLARIVPRVLLEETAQEIAAPGASKADREDELVAPMRARQLAHSHVHFWIASQKVQVMALTAADDPPSAATIEDQLNVLDQLAAKGYITQSEY